MGEHRDPLGAAAGGTGPVPCPALATSRTQAGSQAKPYLGRYCPPQIPATSPQGALKDSTARVRGLGCSCVNDSRGLRGGADSPFCRDVMSGRPMGLLREPPRASVPAPPAGTSELTDSLSAVGAGRTPTHLHRSCTNQRQSPPTPSARLRPGPAGATRGPLRADAVATATKPTAGSVWARLEARPTSRPPTHGGAAGCGEVRGWRRVGHLGGHPPRQDGNPGGSCR